MEIDRLEPPREFAVGDITIRHAADVRLEPDEQVTFTTPAAPSTTWRASRGASTRRRRSTAACPRMGCGRP